MVIIMITVKLVEQTAVKQNLCGVLVKVEAW